ncbi:nuclease [Litorivicinus lipolyticus]|uniref:Nuclease n=1 Tax=Litorivicinus lipolyticus TaxID=418701 RepID=A0A5Q2Q6W3_9GAMM|nr:NERD domain-containing protein [Litorivicinus lipolyticus]QGG79598.1 nuclease [Litorivicinus lipolyticus]
MIDNLWLLPATLLLILIVLLMLFQTIDENKFAGWLMERKVATLLRRELPNSEWRHFHNVTLEIEGKTTQIDHICVSRFGVFVIESKNYGGWIFGQPEDPRWTQTFFKKRFYFQNPLRQNATHTNALAKVLEIAPERLTSVVIFSRRSTPKTQLPSNVVWGGAALIKHLRSFQTVSLTAVEYSGICSQLGALRLPATRKTAKAHIANLEQRRSVSATPAKAAVTSDKCPRCNSPMVPRLGRKGRLEGIHFLGCSTFPKCRFHQVPDAL